MFHSFCYSPFSCDKKALYSIEAEMLFEKHVYERQNRFLYCFITTKQRDKDLTLLNHWVNFIPGLA